MTNLDHMDIGLYSLVAIARFHQIPADSDQLAHQFGIPGQPFTDTELLLAAKAIGLKAKVLTLTREDLTGAVLPAIAKDKNGGYFVLARVSSGEGSDGSLTGALIHDLREPAPR